MHICRLFFNNIALKRFSSHCYSFNFDGAEEILTNYLNQVIMIGINLPKKKNCLTESAVEKLNDCFKKFNEDDKCSVVVLHGCGGNFCTGIENSETALEKGKDLIKTMKNVKKPIIGSLNGYTKNFGFQLALSCDLRAMDETALISLGDRDDRLNIPDEIYKRLTSEVGIIKSLEMALTTCSFNGKEAYNVGLVNQYVECGTALGKAVNWAQSVALCPPEVAIELKKKILSSII